jgi:hypothetical protein
MKLPFLGQSRYNLSYLASGATEDIVVGDRLPVFFAKTVTISVRIHRLNLAAGANFQFLVYGSNPSPTDAQNFVTSSTIGSTATITTATPNIVALSAMINEPVHPFVRIVLRATAQPSGSGTIYGEFSGDLVARGSLELRGVESIRLEGAAGQDAGSGGITPPPWAKLGMCCSGQSEDGKIFTGCTAKAGVGANGIFNKCSQYGAICSSGACNGEQGNKSCTCGE